MASKRKRSRPALSREETPREEMAVEPTARHITLEPGPGRR